MATVRLAAEVPEMDGLEEDGAAADGVAVGGLAVDGAVSCAENGNGRRAASNEEACGVAAATCGYHGYDSRKACDGAIWYGCDEGASPWTAIPSPVHGPQQRWFWQYPGYSRRWR